MVQIQELTTPSHESEASTSQDEQLKPGCSNSARVLVKLFLHSVAMFTLPFVAYFFAKRYVTEEWDMSTEQGYIYGAIAAIITVNVVIGSYIYQAVIEERNDNTHIRDLKND